jgi:hypothetical protein
MELEVAQIELEQNPDEFLLQEIWREKEAAVCQLEANKAKWASDNSRRHAILAGRNGYRQVFRSFKSLAKATEIVSLEDVDGTEYDNWEDMERITVQYFGKLFTSEDTVEETDIDAVLEKLNLRLSQEDHDFLNALFTGEELLEALKGLG